jgi:hypothetical protein
MPFRTVLRRTFNAVDRRFDIRGLLRDGGVDPTALEGDRAIEWSWVISRIPRNPVRILDFGSVQSVMTMTCVRLGHSVTSIDLRPLEYEQPGVDFRQGDLLSMTFDSERYDVIINSSTIEHVGLAGRYGSEAMEEGDLSAMAALRRYMKNDGRMLLTIPVGLDDIYPPYHRIYGAERLPRLLEGFSVCEDEFWRKYNGATWQRCSSAEALREQGSASLYALGLFVLKVAPV